MANPDTRMARARRRALRAARAVTFGVGLGGLACSSGTTGGDAAARDLSTAKTEDLATAADLATALPDLAAAADLATLPDLAAPRDLARPPDVARLFDIKGDLAGFDGECPDGGNAGVDPDCCVQMGGFWINGGCAVPGPFVPPSMPA